jgi:hypothetical protein
MKRTYLGDLFLQRALELLLIQLRSRLGHDRRPHFFSILCIFNSKRDGFRDAVEREQGGIQLDG